MWPPQGDDDAADVAEEGEADMDDEAAAEAERFARSTLVLVRRINSPKVAETRRAAMSADHTDADADPTTATDLEWKEKTERRAILAGLQRPGGLLLLQQVLVPARKIPRPTARLST
jgi:hypothetical protein